MTACTPSKSRRWCVQSAPRRRRSHAPAPRGTRHRTGLRRIGHRETNLIVRVREAFRSAERVGSLDSPTVTL